MNFGTFYGSCTRSKPFVLQPIFTPTDSRASSLVEMDMHHLGVRNIPSDWTSVLKLATLWEFDPIRKQAIRMLIGQEPITRIVLAQTYHIKGWMEDALYSLIHRDEPLDLTEFNILGQDLAVDIVKLREHALKSPDRCISPHPDLL